MIPSILENGTGYKKLQLELEAQEPAPYDIMAVQAMMRRLTEVVDTMHSRGMYIDTLKLKEAARNGLGNLGAFASGRSIAEQDSVAGACLVVAMLRNLPRKKKKRYQRMKWDILRKSEPGAPHSLSTYTVSPECMSGESRIGVMNLTYDALYGFDVQIERRSKHQRRKFMRGVAYLFSQFHVPKNAVCIANPNAIVEGKKI